MSNIIITYKTSNQGKVGMEMIWEREAIRDDIIRFFMFFISYIFIFDQLELVNRTKYG